MEPNKDEALKAKEIAEKKFSEKDFLAAKSYALKAKSLYPELEGISQMVATFDVYAASKVKQKSTVDCYSILGLKPSADQSTVKKQYKKMAVLLHPDKNKTVGADGAFKLVSEAWTFLLDNFKRNSYDPKVNKQPSPGVVQTNTAGVTGYSSCANSSTSHVRLDTFWTVCTSCKVQYEYLRKYVNKRLSCKNCRATFIAVETGTAPANGSFPYCSWSHVPSNGYGSHGFDGVSYVPTNHAFNGVSGYHSGHGSAYTSNVSYQWTSLPGNSTGIISSNGSSTISSDVVYPANGSISKVEVKDKSGTNGKRSMKTSVSIVGSNEPSGTKAGRPDKRRKAVLGASCRNGQETESKSSSEARLPNGNANTEHGISSELAGMRSSVAPTFDVRKMLINKAMTEIRKKLEELSSASSVASASAAVAKKIDKAEAKIGQSKGSQEAPKRPSSVVSGHQSDAIKTVPLSITVPDPDFHDFDKDRSEECFKPKQIWALYDEGDGMPRLYCLIRQIISVKPFKIHITYLNSKTDTEFGSVNWLNCGFTKSCGNFRAWNSDVVDQVNIFSHVLSREKAGRGGCVRIYPRSGDIWAVYRNWSPDWNRSTPADVRHQYEMVEVLDNYSEELGVWVTPLVKLAGFKTVYQRTMDQNAVQWIPRREMMRFSHQVPSCMLNEVTNLPNGCWDLDPAATPDDLLHGVAEAKA